MTSLSRALFLMFYTFVDPFLSIGPSGVPRNTSAEMSGVPTNIEFTTFLCFTTKGAQNSHFCQVRVLPNIFSPIGCREPKKVENTRQYLIPYNTLLLIMS
jgi:hypothetical protein